MDYFKDKDEIPPSQQDSVISMLQQEGLHATRTVITKLTIREFLKLFVQDYVKIKRRSILVILYLLINLKLLRDL
jgi:hypothetical protein